MKNLKIVLLFVICLSPFYSSFAQSYSGDKYWGKINGVVVSYDVEECTDCTSGGSMWEYTIYFENKSGKKARPSNGFFINVNTGYVSNDCARDSDCNGRSDMTLRTSLDRGDEVEYTFYGSGGRPSKPRIQGSFRLTSN